MNKYHYIFIILLLSFLLVNNAYGGNPDVIIKKSQCTEEGVVVKYGLLNPDNYDRPNITVVFKILDGNKTIGCNRINTTIPSRSDGSDLKEILINAPCAGEKTGITYRIYLGGTSKYRIENFESDCPK